MATITTQTHASHSPLNLSFGADTDFTVLADYCEHFADAMIECNSPGLKRALCYRLAECCELIQPKLNDPIPQHLVASLTVDKLPDSAPTFEPDSDHLCGYCHTLAQILSNHNFTAAEEKSLTGLLFELSCYFADEVRAPRFVRTGVVVQPVENMM
ncbi:hypothetical protein [Buttiauxella noackiae]|uniref:hypothetical protein n=1 Tax=Buttiauxella noackiae TaxID=82992 RepID=UPI000557474F|nr:hypothetical protein [Buttiauxella noackiae]